MLGWIIAGLIGALIISDIINRNRIREVMASRGFRKVLVEEISRCRNTVKISDFDSNTVVEIRGDSVADDLREREVIYV